MIRESTKIPTNAQMPSDDPDRHRHMKSDVSSLKRENQEVSLLVKSLKMKSKQIQLPSEPKKDEGVQSKEVEENNGVSNLVQSLKKTKKLKK